MNYLLIPAHFPLPFSAQKMSWGSSTLFINGIGSQTISCRWTANRGNCSRSSVGVGKWCTMEPSGVAMSTRVPGSNSLRVLGQAHPLPGLPGGGVDKQVTAGLENPGQLPAIIPKGGGIAVVDDVDGHYQVEAPGGERQAAEVGLHQVCSDCRGGGVGQARLEESQHLGVAIRAPDPKPRLQHGQQVAAHPAAGVQNPAKRPPACHPGIKAMSSGLGFNPCIAGSAKISPHTGMATPEIAFKPSV